MIDRIKHFTLVELLIIVFVVITLVLAITIHNRELECWQYRSMPYGDIPVNCIHYVNNW